MLFTIDASNAVEAFESLDPNVQDISGCIAFSNQAQLESATKDWPISRFVEIWNDMAGGPPLNLKPVKKFENRATALARIWNAVRRLGNPTADSDEPANPAPTSPTVASDAPVSDDVTMTKNKRNTAKRAPKAAKAKTAPKKTAPAAAAKSDTEHTPRPGSKMELVIGLLKRKNGATIDEVCDKTGWLKHTTRAYISATLGKKLGLAVQSEKTDKGRVYRIAA